MLTFSGVLPIRHIKSTRCTELGFVPEHLTTEAWIVPHLLGPTIHHQKSPEGRVTLAIRSTQYESKNMS